MISRNLVRGFVGFEGDSKKGSESRASRGDWVIRTNPSG
jgi:hypothetical protein